ncbi:hypothetical protein C8J57DRAFT_1235592 [Mycena rebaudengoi]|nr:hypothetical protein C8J57DRAFT_1235592 [Mycena rebaudengoi]
MFSITFNAGAERRRFLWWDKDDTLAQPRPSQWLTSRDVWPMLQESSLYTITVFDPSAFQHTLGSATLNIDLVHKVLAETGPTIDQTNSSLWHFAAQPRNFRLQAKHEADYYNWLDWMVCHPAASAVNAVRDKLYQLANATVPEDGYSRTDIVHDTTGGGAADIIHLWSKGPNCTPHGFKRAKVLRVDGESVLDYLFEQAGAESGYCFRSTEVTTLKGQGQEHSVPSTSSFPSSACF